MTVSAYPVRFSPPFLVPQPGPQADVNVYPATASAPVWMVERAVPESFIYINALPNVAYHLATQLVLRKQRMDPRGVLVSDDRSLAFGAGATEAEALGDFASMLVERYEHLSESEATLSTRLRGQLQYLRSVLVPDRVRACP